jgi:hypothetical protein
MCQVGCCIDFRLMVSLPSLSGTVISLPRRRVYDVGILFMF